MKVWHVVHRDVRLCLAELAAARICNQAFQFVNQRTVHVLCKTPSQVEFLYSVMSHQVSLFSQRISVHLPLLDAVLNIGLQ